MPNIPGHTCDREDIHGGLATMSHGLDYAGRAGQSVAYHPASFHYRMGCQFQVILSFQDST